MATVAAPTPTIYRRAKPRLTLGKVALYATVLLVSLVTIFPIYWMLVSTFQPSEYTLHYPPPLFPQEIIFTQFADLFANHPIGRWLWNSFLIASMALLICMALTVPGAYVLSRLRWWGRSSFGLFLLVTQMLPEILIIIPLYMIYRRLNLLDSLPSLSVVDAAFALPVCIWILKGVFDTVPMEVLDAAVIDGCNDLSVLWRIILPLSTPGLIAVSVFTFTGAWNELLLALIFITSPDRQTVPVALQYLITGDVFRWGQIMAGSVLAALPVMILYYLAQRFVVQGLAAGAVKG